MESYSIILLPFIIFIWACLHFLIAKVIKRGPKATKTTPPGPYPYPIIGNILELGQKPHQRLFELSKTHGPIMSLKLGSLTTLVISSPEIAKEALTKNDLVFANRETPDIMKVLGHHKVSLVWQPLSDHWRFLRKICATNIFCPQKLDSTKVLRQKKVQELLNFLNLSCTKGEVGDIGEVVFTTIINSLSYMFFSVDFAHYDSDNSALPRHEFREIIEEIMVETGKPNVSDFFPLLRFLDPQRIRRRGEVLLLRLRRIFDGIIDERIRLRTSQVDSDGDRDDLLDTFLDLMEEKNSPEFSRNDFLHFLLDLFVAGADTSTSTVEWAMAELLRNPEIMAKTKEELEDALGKEGKLEESDTTKFSYLHAIVKETFRLHPPVPLLHHKSNSEAEICGFKVSKDTQVLVNLWAIGRDPSTWGNDPNCFVPERFLGSKMDVKGHDFELIPFGAGRRICPGLPLAHRLVLFILASLLHCFDWKVANGKESEELDMSEKYGLAIRRFHPLRAIPIKGN